MALVKDLSVASRADIIKVFAKEGAESYKSLAEKYGLLPRQIRSLIRRTIGGEGPQNPPSKRRTRKTVVPTNQLPNVNGAIIADVIAETGSVLITLKDGRSISVTGVGLVLAVAREL